MSYVVEIIRPIAKSEVRALVAKDPQLVILADSERTMEVGLSGDESRPLFSFAQGRLTLTTPGDAAREKAQEIAAKLRATVIGEEDELPLRAQRPGSASVRSGWVGWPVLVLVLIALLAWKW